MKDDGGTNVIYASELADRYGEDLFRFDFILTVSQSAAEKLLSDTMQELTGAHRFTKDAWENKLTAISRIYKKAPKYAPKQPDPGYLQNKSEEFVQFLKLPLKKRAVTHLTLYEDLTADQAEEVLRRK